MSQPPSNLRPYTVTRGIPGAGLDVMRGDYPALMGLDSSDAYSMASALNDAYEAGVKAGLDHAKARVTAVVAQVMAMTEPPPHPHHSRDCASVSHLGLWHLHHLERRARMDSLP